MRRRTGLNSDFRNATPPPIQLSRFTVAGTHGSIDRPPNQQSFRRWMHGGHDLSVGTTPIGWSLSAGVLLAQISPHQFKT
jgi:hypothetical protein